MFNYKSEKEIKEILIKIDNTLNEIEVKGKNVENLFLARAALKDIFDNLKPLEDIPKEKEE